MATIVYVIPGFSQTTNEKGFKKISEHIRKKGFTVVPVKITWKRKVMTDYVNEFKEQLVHQPDDKVFILGFSFGAMIATITAPEIKPSKLFLCSLSPYFKEDLKDVKDWWRKIAGKHRLQDFQKHSFNTIAKEIICPATLIAGEKEPELLLKRVSSASKLLFSKKIIIKGAKHDISQKEYLEEVLTQLKQLT